MRHIAIIIFFGALLQGCGGNRKEVSIKNQHKVQTESASVASAKAPARKQALRRDKTGLNSQSAMRSDKVTTGRAAPLIQSEKKPLRAMTFNEAQFSDKKSTFPRTPEALKLEKEKYNN